MRLILQASIELWPVSPVSLPPMSMQQRIDYTIVEFDRPDILVNNVIIFCHYCIIDCPLEELQDTLEVNNEGASLCSRAAAKQMIDHAVGGCIINNFSVAVRKADPKHADYSASKSVVVCFTRILSLELGEYDIRSDVILPDATESEMFHNMFTHRYGKWEAMIDHTVLCKFATPHDQTNAALKALAGAKTQFYFSYSTKEWYSKVKSFL